MTENPLALRPAVTPADNRRSKQVLRQILIEHIANPDHPFPTRQQMSVEILGYSHSQNLYNRFTATELAKIEADAMNIRLQSLAKQIPEIMDALLKQAKDGNVTAVREYLDRTLGKVADRLNAKVDTSIKIEVVNPWAKPIE